MAIISQLPGKAFELWLLIRYRTDLTGKSEITLPSELLKEWGIRRDAKADGLRRLVEAGEIKIEHQQGHSTKVKLINARKNRRQRWSSTYLLKWISSIARRMPSCIGSFWTD
jgi:hypothetical protein